MSPRRKEDKEASEAKVLAVVRSSSRKTPRRAVRDSDETQSPMPAISVARRRELGYFVRAVLRAGAAAWTSQTADRSRSLAARARAWAQSFPAKAAHALAVAELLTPPAPPPRNASEWQYVTAKVQRRNEQRIRFDSRYVEVGLSVAAQRENAVRASNEERDKAVAKRDKLIHGLAQRLLSSKQYAHQTDFCRAVRKEMRDKPDALYEESPVGERQMLRILRHLWIQSKK